jgi:hypothetical protein
MQILIDTIDGGPHQQGDLILHVQGDNWEMEVRWTGIKHRIYFYRLDIARTDWRPHTIDVVGVPKIARAIASKAWREVTGDQV